MEFTYNFAHLVTLHVRNWMPPSFSPSTQAIPDVPLNANATAVIELAF